MDHVLTQGNSPLHHLAQQVFVMIMTAYTYQQVSCELESLGKTFLGLNIHSDDHVIMILFQAWFQREETSVSVSDDSYTVSSSKRSPGSHRRSDRQQVYDGKEG